MRSFASEWDEALASSGPPAIFTLDPEGKLRVDPERTREIFLIDPSLAGHAPGHWVLTDRRTGLRLYLYVTHPALARLQPRGDVEQFADARSAIEKAMQQWAVPPPEAPVD